MNQENWKLVAPDVDRLLNCFRDDWKNPSTQTPVVLDDEQFEEAKKAWGYYFVVAGKAWNRSVEATSFYVALKRAGLPVVLRDANAILARFEGTDYVGVVPHDVFPRYCESMFPERYGTILDFIHVYDDDMESFGSAIEWLPEEEARLVAGYDDIAKVACKASLNEDGVVVLPAEWDDGDD